ncbi:MAG: ribulose-phosphate 3-epimerase [Mycoplasmataceae bacterium]|nr:ribulose-phosphate 3-epimerase [Mycoplasmataceae bacterium]
MKDKYICPSLLSVAKEKRIEVADQLLKMGIKWIHYDIMDNKFVNNKAIEIEEYVEIIKSTSSHLSDVHLMVKDPFIYAEEFKKYATCMTIHFEALTRDKILEFVQKYQELTWIGLAIKPGTSFEEIKDIIHHFEVILVMSVEPGFGGQKFIDYSIDKIKLISNFIKQNKLSTLIQVDGGINDLNAKKVFNSGANALVCGSYLINNLNEKTLKKLL